jgi:hypothetical protein
VRRIGSKSYEYNRDGKGSKGGSCEGKDIGTEARNGVGNKESRWQGGYVIRREPCDVGLGVLVLDRWRVPWKIDKKEEW